MDSYQAFFWRAQPALLGFFVILFWLLIVLRLRYLRKSNMQYPSIWRTVSASCLVLSAALFTIYFALWIALTVLSSRLLDLDEKYSLPVYPGAEVDAAAPANISSQDMDEIVHINNCYSPLFYVVRIVLNVSLWGTKFAFLFLLAATWYCLTDAVKRIFCGVSIITVLSCIVSLWAMTFAVYYNEGFGHYTGADFIPGELWKPTLFQNYWPRLEYTATAVNIAVDVLLTILACLTIRVLPAQSRDTRLLVVMLVITVCVAVVRLIVLHVYFDTMTMLADGGGRAVIVLYDKLNGPMIILSEFEPIVSAFVSCLPGLRIWTREKKHRKGWQPSEQSASIS